MRSLYSDSPTWLHSVPAGLKLLLLALLGTGLLLSNSVAVLLGSAVAGLLLFLSLRRAMQPALPALKAVLLAALLVFGFHAVMGRPLLGLNGGLRILCTSMLGIALTVSTRADALLELFERLLSPLRFVGIKGHMVALQLALMLRFTEHFFAQWKRLDEAHRLRTGKPGRFAILAPLTIQMLTVARRVADALQLRLGD